MLVDFYFAQKTYFPKDLLPNSGCGLSTDAAYTRVNTVNKITQCKGSVQKMSNEYCSLLNEYLDCECEQI